MSVLGNSTTGWKHFSLSEMTCQCGCEGCEMEDSFMEALHVLRKKVRKVKKITLPVSSGYRCSEHNQNVSRTGPNGPHTTGLSADISCSGEDAFIILQCAIEMDIFTGIGINQKGDWSRRFIHLDTVPGDKRPRVWSY